MHITFDGNLLSVQRGIYGGALQPLYTEVNVSAFSTHTDVSFGKGKAADYQFDDLRLQADTISALSASRRYEYDALGRRVLQTVLVDGVPVNTFFIYDGDRVIEEYRDLEGGTHQLQARYVYGQYIDEVLQRELDLDNNGTPEVVHYYLHDDLYNVVGVTDDTGKLVERYEYGEYGKPAIFQVPASGPEVEISASAIGNRYMFNGREYDSGTGLYWYRTRYMDPEQGRFIARDTIGAWGDANNLGNPFAYVGNNPWSGLDPYGEQGYAMGNPANMSPAEVRQYLESERKMVEGVRNAIIGAATSAWEIGTTLYEQTQNPERHRREVQDGLSVIGDIFRADDSRGGASAGGMMLTDAEAGVGNYIGRIQNDSATVSGEWMGDWLLGTAFTKGLKYLDELSNVGSTSRNVGTITRTSGTKVLAAETKSSPMSAGVAFEAEQLSALNLAKNNSVWRPSVEQTQSAAFKVIVGEAQYTQSGGLPVGTILDATSSGLLEIKGGGSMLNSSYQLRLQVFRSLVEGKQYTIRTSRPVNPAFHQLLQRWGISIEVVD